LVLDLVDATAMLWRLQLLGVEVGARWRAVADLWTPHAGVGLYAFNDAHAMLAFVSAGYRAQAETVLAAQQRVIETCEGDNRKFSADVGYPCAGRSRPSPRVIMPTVFACSGRCVPSPSASAAVMRSAI
jgi:hypothetical protein